MPAAFGKSYNWNCTWPQMVIVHKETLEFAANGFAGHSSTFPFCRMVLYLPGPPHSFPVISTHPSWVLTPEGVGNIFAICTVNSRFLAFCMPSWNYSVHLNHPLIKQRGTLCLTKDQVLNTTDSQLLYFKKQNTLWLRHTNLKWLH